MKTTEAVFVVVLEDGKVLLQKRKNTGWLDGWYDLPSGHIEPHEQLLQAAARELEEETGLKASPEDLELFHVSQNNSRSDTPYTYFVFRAQKWQGTAKVGDPDYVAEVKLFDLENLPAKTAPYIKRALEDISTKTVTFSYFGPDDNG